jgi:hypothetical protein
MANANTDVDKLIAFGKMALEQGWYDQAREDFEQALALDASNREAMKGLARVNEILSRKEAAAVESMQGEPIEPLRRTARSIPEKRPEGQRRSPVQWFKSQSRLGKIAILVSTALLFCCLCVGLAIPAVFISLWNPFTPPTQPTMEIIPTVTSTLPTLAPFLPTTPTLPTLTPFPPATPTTQPTPTKTPVPTATPRPIARIGDTIPEVGADNRNLSMTLIAWMESDIAVDGPYQGEFYTFTARPGMKFVILIFELRNNWVREQYTPYLSAGELLTDKGYFYRVRSPPLGIHSEEYKPRPSTEETVQDLVGNSGGFEKLLPEESVRGCIVFEIPEEQKPVEAKIGEVPLTVRFQ